jgi:DHA3 family macrolide efflux protein-like MFS transporter
MLAVLRHRSFAFLWLGQVVSRLGDGLYEIALVWLVFHGTQSTLAASGVFIAFSLPTLIFSLFGGVMADRFDRKKILVGCDWLRGLILVVLALVLRSGTLPAAGAYAITFVLSSIARFFTPAYTSTVPMLVPRAELAGASALNKLTGMAADVAGPILGGILVAALSPGLVLLVDGLTFLFAGLMTVLITMPPDSRRTGAADSEEEATSIWAEMRAGIQAVVHDRLIVALVTLVAVLNLLLSPLNVVLPKLAEMVGNGSSTFGLMAGTVAAGSAVSAIFTPRLFKKYGGPPLIVLSTVLMAICFAVLSLAPGLLWAALGLFAVIGVCVMLIQIPAVVILQEHVPNQMLGRVASTLEVVSQAALPLGSAVAGVMTDRLDVRWFFMTVGVLVLATGLFFRRQVRSLPGTVAADD